MEFTHVYQEQRYHPHTFFKKNMEDISPFCGVTNIPVLDSGGVSFGFQSRSGQPYSCLEEAYVCNPDILRTKI